MGTATISKKTVETTMNSPDFQLIMRDMMVDWLKNNPADVRDVLFSALREAGYEAKPIRGKEDYWAQVAANKPPTKEVIQDLQELFKDEPPAEEILRIMRPEKYLETSNI